MIPEKKYTIPTLSALAVSMTACPTVADTPEGDWEAIEFDGKEISDHYTEAYGCKSYLDISMNVTNTTNVEGGTNVTMVWKLSYDCDDMSPTTTYLSGDYIIDENGKYDISVYADNNGSDPAQLRFICTYGSDAMDCAEGSMTTVGGEKELNTSYFDRVGGKTE